MTRNELCEALSVTPTTTFNWQRKGMPKEKKMLQGQSWRWDFNIDDVRNWLRTQIEARTDELKNEILWERGKLMKVVCAWCGKEMGYKPGNGIPKQETHGICKPCAEKVKREANNELYKFRRSE